MNYELLPCPFCGSKARMHDERVAEDCMEAWVICNGCGASSERIEGAYSERPAAALAWNNRAASPSSKSTKEAPDLWIIFDSQGPYDLRDSEEQAQRFCTHYNKREMDPLKPYTYRRYLASSSIKEDGERAEPQGEKP